MTIECPTLRSAFGVRVGSCPSNDFGDFLAKETVVDGCDFIRGATSRSSSRALCGPAKTHVSSVCGGIEQPPRLTPCPYVTWITSECRAAFRQEGGFRERSPSRTQRLGFPFAPSRCPEAHATGTSGQIQLARCGWVRGSARPCPTAFPSLRRPSCVCVVLGKSRFLPSKLDVTPQDVLRYE